MFTLPPQRNSSIKWSIIIAALLGLAFIILRAVPKFFISEVIQEVRVENVVSPSQSSIGSRAPYFDLPTPSGEKVKLSDFFGRPVVVTFWATWNAPSADQIKIFDDYLAESGAGLFEIIAVDSQEDKKVLQNFLDRAGYKVRVLSDAAGEVSAKYAARYLPVSYFIDREGIVRDVFRGVLSRKMLVEKVEQIVR